VEYENDKTYMFLVLLTFLAYAAAIGFAYLEWKEYKEEQVQDLNIFS